MKIDQILFTGLGYIAFISENSLALMACSVGLISLGFSLVLEKNS